MILTLTSILHMGGYGMYVWPAYCITLLVFSINLFITFQEKRAIKKTLKKWVQDES